MKDAPDATFFERYAMEHLRIIYEWRMRQPAEPDIEVRMHPEVAKHWLRWVDQFGPWREANIYGAPDGQIATFRGARIYSDPTQPASDLFFRVRGEVVASVPLRV